MTKIYNFFTKISLLIILAVSLGTFIYAFVRYFGNEQVTNIEISISKDSINKKTKEEIIHSIEDSINNNFNRQKEIFELLIAITSFAIFIISLITSINLNEKSKEIERQFSEIKSTPEKLIRIFYTEILNKIRQQLNSPKSYQSLSENLRFLIFAPTIYPEDYELFLTCYEYFKNQYNMGETIGLTCSAQILLRIDLENSLKIIKKDIISNRNENQYMEGILQVSAHLLDKEYIIENLTNTNYINYPITYAFDRNEIEEKDIKKILLLSDKYFKQNNINLVAGLYKNKKVIIKILKEMKIEIPYTIFQNYKIKDFNDLIFADKIIYESNFPDWLKKDLSQEIINKSSFLKNEKRKSKISLLKTAYLREYFL